MGAVWVAVVVVLLFGVAQASVEPQASMFEKPEKPDVAAGAGAGFGWDGGAGEERLKAEFIDAGGDVTVGLGAAVVVDEGIERSKRSPMPDEVLAAGLDTGAEGVDDVNEEKSPKPLEELKVRCC